MTEHQECADRDLSRYKQLQWKMRRCQDQIDRLEDACERATSRTDSSMLTKFNADGTKELVFVSPANRPTEGSREEYLAALVDSQNDYWRLGLEAEELCREIERKIKAWTEPVECEVLTRYYCLGQRLEQISCELSTTNFAYSYSSVKRHRWSGLERFGKRLMEEVEMMSRNEPYEAVNM